MEKLGADIHDVLNDDRGGKCPSFTELLVGQGKCFTLSTIRWLALKKKVDVQFMESASCKVRCVGFRGDHTKCGFRRFMKGFEKIRQDQARLFFEERLVLLDEEKEERSSSQKTCTVCGRGTHNRCKKCELVRFCSPGCMVAGWKKHKLICAGRKKNREKRA
mmetsp:Transcript_30050/g.51910  ORF Transcript_30050/g.51910 Transcript_30050/m.51910 type:complete len:162 (-) Transcript_30050:32-517(-)